MGTASGISAQRNGHISSWSITGDGLSASERESWRRQIGALQLSLALDHSPAFWEHVEECRCSGSQAETGWRLARRYGQGQRRLAVARLMLRAATAPRPRDARGRLFTIGCCFVSEDRAGDRAPTYRLGAAFLVPLQEGARFIAARGAGQCLSREDGTPCPSSAVDGSLYCRRHDSEPVRAKVWRERQMRRAFDAAVQPILRGLPLPEDVEDALEDVVAGRR